MIPRMNVLCGCAATISILGLAGAVGPLGPGAMQPQVHWTLTATDPASGLIEVRAEIPPEVLDGVQTLSLVFVDLKESGGNLRTISARQDGKTLDLQRVQSRAGHRCEVRVPESSRAITIEYQIDPTFAPPGRTVSIAADARGRLTQELGVLRTTTIFPRSRLSQFESRVSFELPPSWLAVTPWPEQGGSFSYSPEHARDTDYLGVGPFRIREIREAGFRFRVAGLSDEDEHMSERLIQVAERARLIAGPLPGSPDDVHSILLIPRGFMRGGSAGRRSIVQHPHPVTLAHEMFHWWNHHGLTRGEAAWFHEGFTEYFGIRIATETGLIRDEFAMACFADLNSEMRYIEETAPIGLAEASKASARDEKRSRLTYAKGALLALLIERRLNETGDSLNTVMRSLIQSGETNLDNAKLRRAFHDAYDGAVDTFFDTYVYQATALPDLGLPPASGESGAAKFLPPDLRPGNAGDL